MTSKRPLVIALSMAGICAVSTGALAQQMQQPAPQPGQQQPAYQQMPPEEQQRYVEMFHRADTDESQFLTQQQAAEIGMDQQTFEQADLDGDGRLTLPEFLEAAQQQHQQAQAQQQQPPQPPPMGQAQQQQPPQQMRDQQPPQAMDQAQQQQPGIQPQQPGEPKEEPPEAAGQAHAAPLTELTAGELLDMTVVNQQGEELGAVEYLVRSRTDDAVYAVVDIAAFVGTEDESVVLPLSEMYLEGDRLIFRTPLDQGQLQQHAGQFQQQEYVEVPPDEPLGFGQAGQ
jgi:hypothetical protein